jgi:hypothetical protein
LGFSCFLCQSASKEAIKALKQPLFDVFRRL